MRSYRESEWGVRQTPGGAPYARVKARVVRVVWFGMAVDPCLVEGPLVAGARVSQGYIVGVGGLLPGVKVNPP